MMRDVRIALRYVLSRFWTRKPIILTHSVTARCNCRCRICNIWSKPFSNNELSKREIFHMLDEASELNFAAYLVWGGEPLLRPDILEIFRHARDNGLYTSMVTNGTLLPQKAEELAELVDLTFVSLDHHTDYHDAMRGRKGTFSSAVRGIAKLRNAGGRVVINCVLSKMNHGSAKEMVDLAGSLGVKVAFDPMEVFDGCNEELALSPTERVKVFSEIHHLSRQSGSVLNSHEYLEHFSSRAKYSCAQPLIFLVVTEDGKVNPFWCKKTSVPLGDLRKQSLSEVLNSNSLKRFYETAKNCSLCVNSTTVETSIYYSARRFFANYFKLNNPYLKFLADYAL
jgi:MoaA/NifB/PqqE/SkfB family radical SAM enzyme